MQAESRGTAVKKDAPLKEDEEIVKMHKINRANCFCTSYRAFFLMAYRMVLCFCFFFKDILNESLLLKVLPGLNRRVSD